MKKILFLLLLFPGFANGQVVNIPDSNFKARLIIAGVDKNADNEIQLSEALAVTYLDISNEFGIYDNINDLTGIESFKNLINLDCHRNQIASLDVSSLTNLENINCSFNTISNLDVLNLNNLLSLNCSGNPIVILNLSNNLMLQSIICGSQLGTTSILNTLALPFPDNNIKEIAVYQTNISYMNLLNYPQLETFEWYNNAVNSFDFSNSTKLVTLSLGGTFTSLDFSALSNLKKIHLALDNNIPLDFSPLVSLDRFSISAIATSFTTLNLNNSPLLNDLVVQGTSIATLDIANCNLLNDIFLNQMDGISSLDLSNFPNLQSVFLKNMTMSNLNLKNGGKLTGATFRITNIKYICSNTEDIQLLNEALSYTDANNFLSNVNSYCTFTPGGNYNTITGATLFDANGNGCDANDVIQPNIKFNINDGTNQGSAFTNILANYSFYTQAGSFEITPNVENPTWYSFSPASYTVPFTNNINNVSVNNFCIAPVGVHNDLEVVIAPIVQARPGFDATYKIIYKNKGNQIVSGNITLNYNDAILDFVTASTLPNTQLNGLLTWNYTNILPFESRSIIITLNLNSPMETPGVNLGDVLNFSTTITPVVGDELPNDNQFTFNQTVVGSYDPNDIICLEGNVVSPSEIGNYLHYVVNFENTGTYEAENVVVKVVVDVNLFDINSLQLLNSSSEVEATITGNVIEFIFKKIHLKSGGHGNILLKVKSKNTLHKGDKVTKKANIYFDYNFPVETLPVNVVFQALHTNSFEKDQSISIYPNPSKGIVNIKCDNTIKSVQLYDVQGRLLQTNLANKNASTLDISNQSKGVYFLKVLSNKGTVVEKIVRE